MRFFNSISALALAAAPGPAIAAEIDFNRDVRPILADNCFACHGFDAASRKAKLRLDTREGATAEVVVPGKPEASELIARLRTSDPDERMPPENSHKKPLTVEQVATLEEWILQGAPWGRHWAFVAPRKAAAVPAGVHPIDHFVSQRLAVAGLAMSAPAAPHTLRRRLAFDLTGLPPAPSDVGDDLSALIDSLLASPHFGERMAMWWLDGARYSDTDGFQIDATRSNWPWRDWVIDAFNSNLPFDRFTIEQFAGDLLPDPTPEQVLATSFHRNHMTNGEGGRDPEESRVDYVLDRTNTTGTLFLGLTLGCTQCHDHKFDPISQADYYSLSAFFNSIDEDGSAGGGAKPYLSYRSPYAKRAANEADAMLAASAASLDEERESHLGGYAEWLTERQAEVAAGGFTPWEIVTATRLAGKEGSELAQEDDGTIQVGAGVPDQDDFTITAGQARLPRVTGLRLEVFPHQTHSAGKYSQAPDGEFILTNIKLRVRKQGSTQVREVSLARAVADVNGKGRDSKYSDVGGTLDDDPRTGWTTRTHPADQPHRAVFELAEPLVLGTGEALEIVLMHRSLDARSLIGRFRLALTDQRGSAVRSLGKMPLEELAEGKRPEGELRKRLLDQYLEDIAAYRSAAARHAEAKRQAGEIKQAAGDVKVMVLAEREQPRKTHVLVRGVWDAHGEEVRPAVLPAVLGREAANDRLALAEWLTSADNPLTARVITNQIWQLFFGAGLVRTPNDFGQQGEAPTHPELLDWLAADFVESGWNLKHLVRTIVTSATYRQSGFVSSELLEIDPDNRLLARGARFRLPAWMIRDSLLASSGLLNPAVGGPPVFPYQPPGLWADQFMGRFTYRPSLGRAGYRRTLYAFWRRSSAPAFLFDNAMRRSCEVTPRRTNTPLHALTLLNDRTAMEAARALAGCDIREIYRRVLGREPSAAELGVCERQRQNALAFYRGDAAAARTFSDGGDAELAAMTLVANLILNLDEALTHE